MPRPLKAILDYAKPRVRDLVFGAAQRARLTAASKQASAHRLTVVTFHRVLPDELRRAYPLPGLVVTPQELAWLLDFFTAHYTCGALSTSVEKWQQAKATKPLLAITFDDGQYDNYSFAAPVLRQFGVNASFYAPVDFVNGSKLLWHDRLGFCAERAQATGRATELLQRLAGAAGAPLSAASLPARTTLQSDWQRLASRSTTLAKALNGPARERHIVELEDALAPTYPEWGRVMTWDELKQLVSAGHEISSHSMTHELLPKCNPSELRYEVEESRHRLKSELHVPADSFCYPNGDCNRDVALAVERAGYRCAITTKYGLNEVTAAPFELKRCDVHPGYLRDRHGRLSEARLAWRLSDLQRGQ